MKKNKDNIQNIYNEVNKVSNSIDTILKSSNIQLSEIKDINKVLLVINKDVKDNILLSDKNINLSEKIKEKINNLTIYIGNIYSWNIRKHSIIIVQIINLNILFIL